MKALGSTVTIDAKYSTYDRMVGVITEIAEDSHLKYTVKFYDGEECYFAEDEILEDNK